MRLALLLTEARARPIQVHDDALARRGNRLDAVNRLVVGVEVGPKLESDHHRQAVILFTDDRRCDAARMALPNM